MVNWSTSDLMDHLANKAAQNPRPAGTVAPVKREDELHDAIEAYCRSQGWLYVHSRMDRASTNQIGCWDFIVALPGGVTLWCEVKRGKSSKLTVEQQAFGAWLTKLGHRTVVARSLEDFVRATRCPIAATKENFTDAMLAAGGEG